MQTSDFEKNLTHGRKKIAEFVLAAKQSGYKIIGFIDKAVATDEGLEKWIARRTKELERGRRNVFAKLSVIVGTIFSSLGVEVHYSTIDCDDTIAAFAHKVISYYQQKINFWLLSAILCHERYNSTRSQQ